MKPVSIVSLSGGMDSAVVLAEAIEFENQKERESRRTVVAVGFSYGSKHNKYENRSAYALSNYYGVEFKFIKLDQAMSAFESDLLMSGGDIPEGHYESSSMSRTVVPGRNIIFGSILAGLAWSLGGEGSSIWMGVHAGDHAIYEDCRPEFINSFNQAISDGTGNRVDVKAPFLFGNKTSIIQRGTELGVPFYLTRTCYKDQEVACGRCGSCQERLEAFQMNGLSDPIPYENREILPR